MEKNILKMSAIIMIMLLMMFCISTTVEAGGFEIDISGQTSPIEGNIKKVSNDIIWIVQAVGYAAATIILVVLAIKYLAASPTDKAEIKKSATIWVVGALILFAGSFILTMIDTFAGSIFGK